MAAAVLDSKRDFLRRRIALCSVAITSNESKIQVHKSNIDFMKNEVRLASKLLSIRDDSVFSDPKKFIEGLLQSWDPSKDRLPWGPELVLEYYFSHNTALEQFIVAVGKVLESDHEHHEHVAKYIMMLGRMVYDRLLPVGLLGLNRNEWAREVLKMPSDLDTVCALLELIGDAEYVIEEVEEYPDEIIEGASTFTFTHQLVTKKTMREVTELDVPRDQLVRFIVGTSMDPKVLYTMMHPKERGTRLKLDILKEPEIVRAICEELNRSDPDDTEKSKFWYSVLNHLKKMLPAEAFEEQVIRLVAENLTRMHVATTRKGAIFGFSYVKGTFLEEAFEKHRTDYIDSLFCD